METYNEIFNKWKAAKVKYHALSPEDKSEIEAVQTTIAALDKRLKEIEQSIPSNSRVNTFYTK